jgi:large subunit ribosomal protein L3
MFQAGQFIDVEGTSKGRGFTGVMKRHNFHGFKASHGVHESYRGGGSIGTSATPSRVFKGKKMPGQHGSSRVTTQNLRLYQIHEDDSLDLIKGAVPGHNGALVAIKKAIKKR